MKEKQSSFLCQSWLGIGIGDGCIDRIFTAAKDEVMKGAKMLFLANASKGIADDHIWFSILMRPPRNQFTRCQRISCCLSTLLCNMLANVMFYQKDKVAGASIDIGSFKFSWTQIAIGIQSALIVLPINLMMVTSFRKLAGLEASPSKCRVEATECVSKCCNEADGRSNSSANDRSGQGGPPYPLPTSTSSSPHGSIPDIKVSPPKQNPRASPSEGPSKLQVTTNLTQPNKVWPHLISKTHLCVRHALSSHRKVQGVDQKKERGTDNGPEDSGAANIDEAVQSNGKDFTQSN